MMNLWWKNQKVDETNNLIFYSRPRQSLIYWSAQSTDSPILPTFVLKPIVLQLILPKMTKHTIPISDEECCNSKGTGRSNWTCLRIKTFLYEFWTMFYPSNSVAVIWFIWPITSKSNINLICAKTFLQHNIRYVMSCSVLAWHCSRYNIKLTLIIAELRCDTVSLVLNWFFSRFGTKFLFILKVSKTQRRNLRLRNNWHLTFHLCLNIHQAKFCVRSNSFNSKSCALANEYIPRCSVKHSSLCTSQCTRAYTEH